MEMTLIFDNVTAGRYNFKNDANDSLLVVNNVRVSGTDDTCPAINLSQPVHVKNELFYVNTTFGICALLGNGLSVILLLRIIFHSKTLRNGYTISILVLATSDFLQALCVYPSIIKVQSDGFWSGGMFMCNFMAFTGNFFQLFSAFIVTMLAVIRYLVLGSFSPQLFKVYIKKLPMWACIIVSTVLITAIASVLPFTNLGCVDFYPAAGVCSYSWKMPGKRRVSLYIIIGINMASLLAILVCTIGTTVMLNRTRLGKQEGKRKRRERRMTIGVITIATVQLFCWGPMVVWMPIFYSGIVTDPNTIMIAYTIAGELLLGASVFNPFCFSIMMRQYRTEIFNCLKLLRCKSVDNTSTTFTDYQSATNVENSITNNRVLLREQSIPMVAKLFKPPNGDLGDNL